MTGIFSLLLFTIRCWKRIIQRVSVHSGMSIWLVFFSLVLTIRCWKRIIQRVNVNSGMSIWLVFFSLVLTIRCWKRIIQWLNVDIKYNKVKINWGWGCCLLKTMEWLIWDVTTSDYTVRIWGQKWDPWLLNLKIFSYAILHPKYGK